MTEAPEYTSKTFQLLAYCTRCYATEVHRQEYRYGADGRCFYKCEPTCSKCGNPNSDGAYRDLRF